MIQPAILPGICVRACVDVTMAAGCLPAGTTCAGDSGGPAILSVSDDAADPDRSDMLVGLVSYGFPRARNHGCPRPNPATVYTDLRNPEINAWLRQVIDRYGDLPEQGSMTYSQGMAARPGAQQSTASHASSATTTASVDTSDNIVGDDEYESWPAEYRD